MNLRKAVKAAPKYVIGSCAYNSLDKEAKGPLRFPISSVTVVEGTASTVISCPVTDHIIGVTYTQKTKDGETVSKNVRASRI